MRISYRTYRGRRSPVYEQVGETCFCCRQMRDEWGILVGFGVKGHPRTSSREVNVFTSYLALASGNGVQGITEIRYCPWCGEEIEIACLK